MPAYTLREWGEMLENSRKSVGISVSSRITEISGEYTGNRMLMMGEMEKKGTGILLHYREQLEEDGKNGPVTDVTVWLRKEEVTVMRRGDYSVTLVFHRGRTCDASYRTPFGIIALRVFTSVLRCQADEEKGHVYIVYQMESGGSVASHEMEILYGEPDSERLDM